MVYSTDHISTCRRDCTAVIELKFHQWVQIWCEKTSQGSNRSFFHRLHFELIFAETTMPKAFLVKKAKRRLDLGEGESKTDATGE